MTLLKRKYDSRSREMHDVAPFTEIADYFNEIVTGLDDLKVAMYLIRLAQKFKVNIRSATEIGCRSGIVLHRLAERGIEVTGVESTQQMALWAKGFAEYKAVPLVMHISDLKKKTPVNNQDLIYSFYQNVNYFKTEEELAEFFSSIRLSIKPDGLFIFDAITELCATERFESYVDYDKVTPGFYAHKAYYVVDTRMLHHFYEMYPHDATIMYVEKHSQYVWILEELVRIAQDHGFSVEKTYESLTFHEGTEENYYVNFVCRPI